MRKLIPLILLGFGVALAIVVGQRMSTDAMAVVVGVAVGVAASVPTSLLLIALLRKERTLSGGSGSFRDEPRGDFNPYPPALPPPAAPSIFVVDPAQYANLRNTNGYPLPPPSSSPNGGVRNVRVIGDGEDW